MDLSSPSCGFLVCISCLVWNMICNRNDLLKLTAGVCLGCTGELSGFLSYNGWGLGFLGKDGALIAAVIKNSWMLSLLRWVSSIHPLRGQGSSGTPLLSTGLSLGLLGRSWTRCPGWIWPDGSSNRHHGCIYWKGVVPFVCGNQELRGRGWVATEPMQNQTLETRQI